jgi:hypothetical protein
MSKGSASRGSPSATIASEKRAETCLTPLTSPWGENTSTCAAGTAVAAARRNGSSASARAAADVIGDSVREAVEGRQRAGRTPCYWTCTYAQAASADSSRGNATRTCLMRASSASADSSRCRPALRSPRAARQQHAALRVEIGERQRFARSVVEQSLGVALREVRVAQLERTFDSQVIEVQIRMADAALVQEPFAFGERCTPFVCVSSNERQCGQDPGARVAHTRGAGCCTGLLQCLLCVRAQPRAVLCKAEHTQCIGLKAPRTDAACHRHRLFGFCDRSLPFGAIGPHLPADYQCHEASAQAAGSRGLRARQPAVLQRLLELEAIELCRCQHRQAGCLQA